MELPCLVELELEDIRHFCECFASLYSGLQIHAIDISKLS